jgi:hypothetical protein
VTEKMENNNALINGITEKFGETELTIYPVELKFIRYFIRIQKKVLPLVGEKEDIDITKIIEMLDDATIDDITKLIEETLKTSLKDKTDIERGQFGTVFFYQLFGLIMRVNSYQPTNIDEQKKKEILDRLRSKTKPEVQTG